MTQDDITIALQGLHRRLRDEFSVAALYVFGSVVRGEAVAGSDVDLLVIIDRGEPWKVRRSLYEIIYPVIAVLGVDVSLMVIRQEDWLEMLGNGDPFAASVLGEGQPLWRQLKRLA